MTMNKSMKGAELPTGLYTVEAGESAGRAAREGLSPDPDEARAAELIAKHTKAHDNETAAGGQRG